MTQRLREFDFIRAFAAFSVIAIHLTASYVTSNSVGAVWNETMRYAVPLFILLSGLVLMYSDLKRPPVSYFTFQRKRFGKVLWPYLLWTIIYVYYNARDVLHAQGLHGAKRIADTLPNHFKMGDGSYHLYFLVITMQLYLLYPLLRAWLRKHPWSLLILSFLMSLVDQYSHYINKPLWRYDLFPAWLFYFVLGMYVITKREWFEKHLRKWTPLLGVLWLASLVYLIYDGRHTNTSYNSIKPTVMLYAIVSFAFFYPLALRFKQTTGKFGLFLDWVSTNSFFIFLVHPLILNRLYLFAKNIHKPTLWDGTVGMVSLYLTTVVLALIVTYVVRFLPFTTLLGAVRPPKRTSEQTNHAQPAKG